MQTKNYCNPRMVSVLDPWPESLRIAQNIMKNYKLPSFAPTAPKKAHLEVQRLLLCKRECLFFRKTPRFS